MKLLHLEDNEEDAELFEAVILREWPDCDITRLSTRREFETALELENFDLILSDHSMPGFDGMVALKMARNTCPETPFVFLSGTIGEERAIEALKLGAADYVLKAAPGRLLPAVRGALTHGEHEVARRRAEESLRRSREQFQQIADNIDDFILLLDERGDCLYANPSLRRLLGKSEVLSGFSVFDDVHPEDRKRLEKLLSQTGPQPGARDIEYRLLLPDGAIRHLEARVSFPRHSEKERPTLLLSGRDVTERHEAEDLLREQASLLDKARDAICVIDLHCTVTSWNTGAGKIFGRPSTEALGSNLRDLLFASQTARFDTVFALTLAYGEWHGEFHLAYPDGRELVVDSSWSLVTDAHGQAKSILCINTDLTKRKHLEQELQRAQRIESLGMLAGGIAHDLNNILSPILMSVGLLRPMAANPESQMILDTLETSANHGAELVHQILLFARGGEGQRTEVRLGELLAGLQGILKTTLRGNIDLQIGYNPELWTISADATQLKQVLMNLCVNARDAMPTGGRVHVTATNVDIQAGTHHGFHGEIPAGCYVRLSVADTGTGIPPELLEKIFDPFFTTKDFGKGTGLGLSTIAGIIHSHDGAINVQSVPGHGTTFHIYLPAIVTPAQPPRQLPVEDLPAGGGEFILVVDDDSGIRLVTEQILSAHGYEVCLASDGQTGLEEFHRQRDRINLVICDQMMPGWTGCEMLAQIHQEAPDVGMIVMSGLGEHLVASSQELPAHAVLLPKPINLATLLQTVRHALSRPKAPLFCS
jgi:PAS domain S-box-containing protein